MVTIKVDTPKIATKRLLESPVVSKRLLVGCLARLQKFKGAVASLLEEPIAAKGLLAFTKSRADARLIISTVTIKLQAAEVVAVRFLKIV